MPRRSSTRSRDINRLAAELVSEATGEQAPPPAEDRRSETELRLHAQALGRKGGLKGGKARAERLTAEQRSAIASKAARARWSAREG